MFVDLKNIMQTGGLEPGYKKPLKSAVTTVKPTELLKPYKCNTYIQTIIIQISLMLYFL